MKKDKLHFIFYYLREKDFSKLKRKTTFHIVLMIFTLLPLVSLSQNEANIWYFGYHAGLDFNSGQAVPITNSSMVQPEGVASISDNQGSLLFYTNGINVWNKNHEEMENGSGLMGGGSSTQSSIIVPQPESNTIYYIFTVPQEIGTNGLRYSIVDMEQNGGIGAVTSKNIFLVQPTEEKVTAVMHANKIDIWVITHLWNSDAFYCYLVTSDGISTNPIITNIGEYHSGPQGDTHGYLRATPCGGKIGIVVRPINSIELFDFDSSTGIISNPLTFPSNFQTLYGIEFSPNESRLYLSEYGGSSKIYQFDLMAGSPSDIFDSKTLVGTVPTSHNGALQLAPDKKIYSAYNSYTSGHEYLGIIHNPNTLGTACNFELDALYLDGGEAVFGLPNFIQSYFCITQDFNYIYTCYGDTTFFSITNSFELLSVSWDFDDPASGSANYSTEQNPYHIFSSPGIYNVKLISNFTSITDTLIKEVIINPAPLIYLGNDTLICEGANFTLHAGSGFESYLWNTGSSDSTITIDTTGTYWVEVINGFGCSATDSIYIELLPSPEINLGNDTTLCTNEFYLLDPGQGYESYLWQDGSTNSTFPVNTSGLYWVEVTNEFGCTSIDSINIELSSSPDINLGNDTTLCTNEFYLLDPGQGYENYLWQDGSTNSTFPANTSGLYWVEVTNEFGCSATDSIYIELLPSPEINLGNDTLICIGTSLTLNAGNGFYSYLWNTGSSDSTITIDTTGTYWVEVFNEFGCSTIDSIIIGLYPNAIESIDIGNDTTFCYGQQFIINAGSGYTLYEWQDGSTDSLFYADTSGVYYVHVLNPCGEAWDTIELSLFPISEIDLGNDTSLCKSDGFVLLDPGMGFNSYLWQDGSSNQFYYTNQSGEYWIEAIDIYGCPVTDTISLNFINPEPELGPDTSICSGNFITFSAIEGFSNYLWQDGSNGSNITANTEGIYWCKVTDTLGCIGTDSVFLELLYSPEISLGNDTSFCFGDSLFLSYYPIDNNVIYLWQDGTSDSVKIINSEGYYWVQATNSCGSNFDSVYVSLLPLPYVFLGEDIIIGIRDEITLDAGDNFESYLWVDGSEFQTITVSDSGNYWVRVSDGFCFNSDTIHIEEVSCDLIVPIVFTPNWDNYNDYFYAVASNDIIEFDLVVYNRWGEKMWETTDLNGKWDGKKNNTDSATGTYFWICEYKCLLSNKTYTLKGSVTLLR